MSTITALDSPLEALALNYVSFGILTVVNNLWTWVAFVTAAISVWRIRTTVKPEQQPCSHTNATGSAHPVHHVDPPSPLPASPPAPAKDVDVDADAEGVMKGAKFTLYYYSEKTESEGELRVVKEWRDEEGCGEWWERVMRVRMGEMGWYRNQDLTVINGNVVRFWDDYCCKRRERCRSYS
ncbi:Transmembrane protein [Melia azedarach]|uniref:Transmembrane protein n=2 Tax=Melia azedarach TaxID=155640 RepID=A0ACC1XCC0_MELAZ|nr:Transmembrane protein [Melia azedarach]